MHTNLKFRCPHCDVGLHADETLAGCAFGCPKCATSLTVPTANTLVPVARPVIVPELVPDDDQYELARRGKRREDDTKPVEMRLGQLVGMKIDVDKKTRNAMATTFLGGLLVALGAILISMLGGKSKSS